MQKNLFLQICNFFLADSKSRAQELSNDVSFVIFGHQTWDLEVGGQIDPPPSVYWFSSTPAGIGLNQECVLIHLEIGSFFLFNPLTPLPPL